MYTCQFRGVVPCVLPPLNSRLDSSPYPPLSRGFLHNLRLTLLNPSGRVSKTSKVREHMVYKTLTELLSALEISASPSPIVNPFSCVNERNRRQFCGICKFGDLRLVLSATHFVNLDPRSTLTPPRLLSTIAAFPPTCGFRNSPKDLVIFIDFCPFLEEPSSTSPGLSHS